MKAINLKVFTAVAVLAITLLCVYVLPVKYFVDSGLRLDQYIFAAAIVVAYIVSIKVYKFKAFEALFLALILLIILIKQDISYIHLLGIVVISKIAHDKMVLEKITTSRVIKYMLFISLICTLAYSILFAGIDARYMYTAIGEPNMSGFALLMLFLMIRKLNRRLGNVLLCLGVLTFSRSYLLSVLIFFVIERFGDDIKNKILKFGIPKITLIFVSVLIGLSSVFIYLHSNNSLVDEYASGVERYTVLNDYSNYFRFTVNTNVLSVYEKNPSMLLTGMENEKFFDLNLGVVRENEGRYRAIKPHNYIFAYLQIYGIWALLIIVATYFALKKLINKNNISIVLVVLFNAMFLGIGLSSYWLFITVLALVMYVGKNDDTELSRQI